MLPDHQDLCLRKKWDHCRCFGVIDPDASGWGAVPQLNIVKLDHEAMGSQGRDSLDFFLHTVQATFSNVIDSISRIISLHGETQ